MTEKLICHNAANLIQTLVSKGKLELITGPSGKVFLRIFVLKFRCKAHNNLHEKYFLTRELAEQNTAAFPDTIQLPDDTEPHESNMWSIHPKLLLVTFE